MKADELCIGDWILENTDEEGCDCPCCWVPNQVSAEHFKLWLENDWIDVDDKAFSEFWRPVELTEEILEKNFVNTDNMGVYEITDDYYDFSIHEINDGIYLALYHCCEMDLPDEKILISYVYELQHFLKHLKIDKNKEIVL